MASSNVFQGLMPTGHGRSFYEELRRGHSNTLDIEDRAGLLDEENLNHDFHDYDLDNAEGLGVDDSRINMDARAAPARSGRRHPAARSNGKASVAWRDEEADNEVPESLMIEPHGGGRADSTSRRNEAGHHGGAIPGPSKSRAQWEAAQTQQQLHSDSPVSGSRHGGNAAPSAFLAGVISGNAKKKAEWRWANVSNLDNFIKDVYDYYEGCGAWCIFIGRILHLIHVTFVAVLLTFLTQCIDYSKLPRSEKLSQILVPQCTRNMSGLWNLGLWMFAFYFIWKSLQFLLEIRRILHVRDFYIHLLNIPDQDMQTVIWQEIVIRIMALRDQNPKTATNLTPAQRRYLGSQSKERLDASDIANRLMRRENYLIALFNKDILDLTIPIPVPFLRGRQLLSQTLEWMLMFSIIDFIFDERGQVNQEFLKSDRRGLLSAKLRSRFMFAGLMILVLSPFVAGYLVIVYILTYYNEIQKNPSVLSSRTYTPLAKWKFREFNELPHLFQKRLDMSHPYATHYIDQFPKVKTEMICQTLAFVAGSLATVLAIVSVFDPEMFLGFEITQDRTVLFYTAVFGGIWAFARGNVSDENKVFEPEYALRNVIQYTHYEPDHWKDRLHSSDVKTEFSELYQMKIVIFLEEILSILTTPFVLFISLPKSSDQIIDFFREFTIHVDGLGYVCQFAEFDFKRGAPAGRRGLEEIGADVRDDYYSTKHGKMEASMVGFMSHYNNCALNPRTGGPSHLPPGLRHQFHPPPAWPPIGSPTLAADMHTSRMGRSEHARSRAPAKAPRSGPAIPQASPGGSVLLDTHHQPLHSGFTTHRANPVPRQRVQYQGEGEIIEESVESGEDGGPDRQQDDEEAYESGGVLGSQWQTSPSRTVSRENSGAEGPDAGVVQMMYQFTKRT
ncbi:autophagy protein Apg9-domain-containing protein [Rhypophila decipiens]|uniref:Autophagy-related protein 9 n=1 Tax=Rhypophila decipiens TaxID=261697 RepID=A0AAN6YE49_9PEZI|nr:autophagy protein Apg9-domain-containing protein [Rhypophila decipiens]